MFFTFIVTVEVCSIIIWRELKQHWQVEPEQEHSQLYRLCVMILSVLLQLLERTRTMGMVHRIDLGQDVNSGDVEERTG